MRSRKAICDHNNYNRNKFGNDYNRKPKFNTKNVYIFYN